MRTVLFLAADAASTPRLQLAQEIRKIDQGLQQSKRREQFVLQQRWVVHPNDLRQAMWDIEPRIVHFSGHGAGTQGIVLEDDTGKPTLVSTALLKEFFTLFPSVECVVLNACYSESQAEAIAQHVPYVISIDQAISDNAAITFLTGFYDGLGAGTSVDIAYQLGCISVRLDGIDERLMPNLIMNSKTKIHWVLILDGDLADLPKKRSEAIVKHLRQLTQDESLKLNNIEPGSIILKLEGSEEGFRIIDSLYKSGKLTEILGLSVGYVGYEVPETRITRPINLFFSYSHKDEELRSELVTHLSILERNGVISGWCDRQITAGEEWESQIDERINSADIVLLLISSDFIASNYCWNIEVKHAMAKHEAGEACVMPIILRPVNWAQTPFGKLQALPKNAKPVTTWRNRDAAFLSITQGIEVAISRLSKSR